MVTTEEDDEQAPLAGSWQDFLRALLAASWLCVECDANDVYEPDEAGAIVISPLIDREDEVVVVPEMVPVPLPMVPVEGPRVGIAEWNEYLLRSSPWMKSPRASAGSAPWADPEAEEDDPPAAILTTALCRLPPAV